MILPHLIVEAKYVWYAISRISCQSQFAEYTLQGSEAIVKFVKNFCVAMFLHAELTRNYLAIT